jgi:hypothetical protein
VHHTMTPQKTKHRINCKRCWSQRMANVPHTQSLPACNSLAQRYNAPLRCIPHNVLHRNLVRLKDFGPHAHQLRGTI